MLSKAFLSFWRNGTRNEYNQRAAQVSGCQGVVDKEEKQGENAAVCSVTQKLA